jgi:5-bromo-4-chloroindolyl phosphate hydrolysis protein
MKVRLLTSILFLSFRHTLQAEDAVGVAKVEYKYLREKLSVAEIKKQRLEKLSTCIKENQSNDKNLAKLIITRNCISSS